MKSNIKIDPLLQTFQINDVVFRNRIMSTSHACGLEDHEAMPGETYQRYHLEKAKGGLALTMFGGSSYVSEDSTWTAGQLNMSSDRIIPYLQDFSTRIHSEGAAIMIQLTHLGRRGETNTQNWLPTIAPSAVRETQHRSFPKEMDVYDIRRVITSFGDAAARAQEGGLDGLETMVGGHLIGQFLSQVTNKRTDEYGGSVENRCRFGLLVQEEIRRRVGDRFIVGMRFPIDEAMRGGLNFDDCVAAAQIFERSGLINFFNANYGALDTELKLLTDCMPSMASPMAPWLEKAGAFKREVNLPVFHAARIADLATARYAIREGLLDMVAMTRAHIADPQIVNKIINGEEDRIRPCVGMTHCMGENRPTCIHNPTSGRDHFWPQIIKRATRAGRKVVVVGGGPAGLEAARILGERGHRVTLIEASNSLGGQLKMASRASWRKDVVGIIDWRISELGRLGVEVVLDHYAEASDLLEKEPEIVIIATGGLPDLDWLVGNDHCASGWDVLTGSIPIAENVIVYDGSGRHPALTAAEFCHDSGKSIELVLLDDRPAAELDYGERIIWKRELARRKIVPLLEQRLCKIEKIDGHLNVQFRNELTAEKMTMIADQVIVEHGTVPADELYHGLRPFSRNEGVIDNVALITGKPQENISDVGEFSLYRIGDAVTSRNIAAAMFDAFRLCSSM